MSYIPMSSSYTFSDGPDGSLNWSSSYYYDSSIGEFKPPVSFDDLLNFIPASLSSEEILELTEFYQNTLKQNMGKLGHDSPSDDKDSEMFFIAYQECQLILRDEKKYLENKLTEINNEIDNINSQMLFASAEDDQGKVTALTLKLPALESRKALNSTDRNDLDQLILMADQRLRQYEDYLEAKNATSTDSYGRYVPYRLQTFNASDYQPSYLNMPISWQWNKNTSQMYTEIAFDGEKYILTCDPRTNEMTTEVRRID